MLNGIIAFSLRNKAVVVLFAILLLGFGLYEATRLPIDAVPDITNNQVQILTTAPAYGATDIERLITFPIEQACSNIAGVIEIRSFSRFGLSVVTVVFEDDVEVYRARQQVAERLLIAQSQIPSDIGRPELGPVTTGLGEIYQYVLRPEKGYEAQFSATELRTIQDWIVRRQLLGVEGVAEVSSFGGKLKQYQIAVDPGNLRAHHITLDDVFDALAKNNHNTGGAYIEKGPTLLFIRSEGLIASIKDIESIPIKYTSSGAPICIHDIAEVSFGYATRYGAMAYNDEGETAGAIVMMVKGGNSSKVVKAVKERVELIQKTLPKGLKIEPFLDRTKMVNNAIHTVEKNLAEGALIVIFILVLFLGNLRAGFIVASVIPLALLFAVILMNAFGVSGNLMSLGALDFGLIVDGAVIIVEAVLHQLTVHSVLKGNLAKAHKDETVKSATAKMMNSAVFGQLIILIVYLPIFTLQGIEGKMFKPMAQTVIFALLGAFILSLTYVPVMSALFLKDSKGKLNQFSEQLMQRIQVRFQMVLVMALRKPVVVFSAVLGLFIGSLILLSRMGAEFIPTLEEGDFAVELRVLTGSNLNTTLAYSQKAAGLLKATYPEVEKVVTKIGTSEVPTDPMPMEAADMMVILKDKSEWTSANSFTELAEKMNTTLKQVPGISVGFQYPVQMRFNELMTGARQDVVCKIFGEDLDTLAFYAQRIGEIANKVEGAVDLFVEPISGLPQVVIQYDRNLLSQYQLDIQEVNRMVNMAFAGQSAGIIYEGEKRFDLVLRLNEKARAQTEDIGALLINTPQGAVVPLRQLAKVEVVIGPNQIQREDAKRRIMVGFNIRGRDVKAIVEELEAKVEQQVRFPAGYYITYGGTFENLQEAQDRLSIAVPIALVLIFFLLYLSFSSLKQAFLIFTAIPLSAIGGIYFLVWRGLPFSISAGIGFMALFGIAVLNGIVLIAEFNRKRQGGIQNLARIVVSGSVARLRPVLVTALVASLGFLPMALSNGVGAELQKPLATVVIGGLLFATLLTLFVLPLLFMVFQKSSVFKKKQHGLGIVLIGLLFCFTSPMAVKAQVSPITLEAALDSAYLLNPTLKSEALMAKYKEELVRSGFSLPQTALSSELGQISSAYFDTKFGVAQSFSFPGVYQKQKESLRAEWHAAAIAVNQSKALISRNVNSLFYHLLVLQERKRLLYYADSIVSDYALRAERRFKAGESNILELTSAQTYRGSILLLQQQLLSEIEIGQIQFQLLLNTTNSYTPQFADMKAKPLNGFDTSSLAAHPMLQWYRQQILIAEANAKVARAKLLPEWSVGYVNQSIQGTGADNQSYVPSDRFHSAQVGVGIPIFYGAQKAKVNAAKAQTAYAQQQYEAQRLALEASLAMALQTYQRHLQILTQYETVLLPNANLITEVANRQVNAGEINYLDWTLQIQQALNVRSNYLEVLLEYNENVFHLNYLLSSPQ